MATIDKYDALPEVVSHDNPDDPLSQGSSAKFSDVFRYDASIADMTGLIICSK